MVFAFGAKQNYLFPSHPIRDRTNPFSECRWLKLNMKFVADFLIVLRTIHFLFLLCLYIYYSRIISNVYVNFTLEQAMKSQRGNRGIAYYFLTSVLDGGGGKRHAPAALPPEKTRYPLYRRLGWAPWPIWTGVENITPQWDSIPGLSSP
jgi:hypothetical protein